MPEKLWSAMERWEVKRRRGAIKEPAFPYTDAGCAEVCCALEFARKRDGRDPHQAV
jgi:hypothetical protein